MYKSKVEEWNIKNSEYIKEQNDYNTEIDELKSRYLSSDANAIAEYCEIVLSKSPLPDFFQKEFEVDYNPDNKILIIDYLLPSIEDFPSVKVVKYIVSQNE